MAESLFVIPFGKFKGKDIEDIPTDYLIWAKGEDWFKNRFPTGFKAVQEELKYREKFGDPE